MRGQGHGQAHPTFKMLADAIPSKLPLTHLVDRQRGSGLFATRPRTTSKRSWGRTLSGLYPIRDKTGIRPPLVTLRTYPW